MARCLALPLAPLESANTWCVMNGLRLAACLALAASGFTFPRLALAQATAPAAPAAAPAPADPAAPPDVPPAPTAPPPAEGPPGGPAPGASLQPTALGHRKIDLSTPPPAPSVPRSYHMHDGFYVRGSV